jgi:hypothetical protein
VNVIRFTTPPHCSGCAATLNFPHPPGTKRRSCLPDPEQLLLLRLVLHPSVQVITSAFSVFSIWAAHQAETSMRCVDPDVAQTVLVFRSELDAAGAASRVGTEFDLANALALLLRLQLITHLTTGDQYHEHTH